MTTVYFIRHAQALSNVAAEQYPKGSRERSLVYRSQEYFNARLSEYGEIQAKTSLKEEFKYVDKVDIIFVSTLFRTLQTAHHGLEKFRHTDSKTKWIGTDTIREWPGGGCHPCDHRDAESLETAKNEFPYVNLTGVESNDPIPQGEPVEAVDKRIGEFLKLLYNEEGDNRIDDDANRCNIVVVSHSGFLCRFYRRVLNEEKWFENCEMKTESLEKVLQEAKRNGFQLD